MTLATTNGLYQGDPNPAVTDWLTVFAGLTIQAAHFEHIVLKGNDNVDLLTGADAGWLTIGLTYGSSGNHLHLADSISYSLNIINEGGGGLTTNPAQLEISGVAGSSVHLDKGAVGRFTTDGTVNVDGIGLGTTKIVLESLAGDATMALSKAVGYTVQDQAAYTVNAHGDILVTENGHTVTLDHFAGQTWQLIDAAGSAFTYAQLVGVIQSGGGEFVG